VVNLTFRIFIDGKLTVEETGAYEPEELETVGARHVAAVGDRPHMIEIEFLDEPDINQRFLRLGTDPRAMVIPTAIDLKTFFSRRP
jgi:hypothetical protein